MALGVGDVFAIIDKSWALYKILEGIRSSNTKYLALKKQAHELHIVLSGVKSEKHLGLSAAPPGPERLAAERDVHDGSSNQQIKSILENCEETLNQLYIVVDKYHVLGVSAASYKNSFKDIGEWLKKTRRKILFTTENDELKWLQSQMELHLNSMGVVLQLVNMSVFPHSMSTTNPGILAKSTVDLT